MSKPDTTMFGGEPSGERPVVRIADSLEGINEQLIVMNNLQLVYLYAAFGQELIDQMIDDVVEGETE